MHPLYTKADKLSHLAIGSAIEVHRLKGPGLIESISPWSQCLTICHLPALFDPFGKRPKNGTEANEDNEGLGQENICDPR